MPSYSEPSSVTLKAFSIRVSHHFTALGFLTECSQMRKTFHPCSCSAIFTSLSLFRLLWIFLNQNSELVEGSWQCILQPCQKQLSKNTAILWSLLAKSGRPSRSVHWYSNSSPFCANMRKNSNSSLVPDPFTAAIARERCAGDKLSNSVRLFLQRTGHFTLAISILKRTLGQIAGGI